MARVYAASAEDTSWATTQRDMMEILSGANIPCELHKVVISQYGTVSDANEDQVLIEIVRGVTTGSGGTTVTPAPLDSGDAAASDSTVEVFNTTAATGGTIVHREAWNIRMPFILAPTPEERITWRNNNLLIRAAEASLATIAGLVITTYFAEI